VSGRLPITAVRFLGAAPPVFFTGVDSKVVKFFISLLESTLAGVDVGVDSK
jgi:hypothetical protein